MSSGSSTDVIPPLKADDGSWATSSQAKADLLAETFAKKCSLDDEEINTFLALFPSNDISQSDGFIAIRRRYARAVLKKLDEYSGTGPDGIAARVFRRCRDVLELPILSLARVVFNKHDGLIRGDFTRYILYIRRNPKLIRRTTEEFILFHRSLRLWNGLSVLLFWDGLSVTDYMVEINTRILLDVVIGTHLLLISVIGL